jgi:putative FmdB family regulatory protein
MPIYEYRCAACGHDLEALQKISDSPLRKCPSCGKSQLRRLVSAPSFRLKGGGWYETDFKGDGEKKRNLVETGARETADKAVAEAKTEVKDTAKEAAPAKETPAKPAAEKPAAAKPTRAAKKAPAKSRARRG